MPGPTLSPQVAKVSTAPDVALTGPERGPAASARSLRGNAARVEECGLSRPETGRSGKLEQVDKSISRLGFVQGEALRAFGNDAMVGEPPPFRDVLVDAFLETAIAAGVGGVAGALGTALMARVAPALKNQLEGAGAVTLAVLGKCIEDATKDGLKQGAREIRATAFSVPPPFFELKGVVSKMEEATSDAWHRGGMEFWNQASGLSDEDLCPLLDALEAMEPRARSLQYAAAAGAWAQYLGEARNLPPSVGASPEQDYERLGPGAEDGDALRIAAARGGVPELGFDPNLMLHVHVALPAPNEGSVGGLRWPGMSPEVCHSLADVHIRDLGVPIRVTSDKGVAFDFDPAGRVFRNVSSGEGRAILRAMGSGRPEQWSPGQASPSIAPGQDPDRGMVDQGALALVHGWILSHTIEAGSVTT